MYKSNLKEKCKRWLCVILVVTIPEIAFSVTPVKAYASERAYERAKEAYYEDNQLQHYLDNEKSNSTGLIENDIEEKLNERGVADNQIRQFTQDDIEALENADYFEVYSQYVAYTPTETCEANESDDIYENKDCEQDSVIEAFNNNDVEGYESRILTKEEIDELVEETYLKDNEDNSSIIDDFLVSIGIKPLTVKAASRSQSDRQETSYLRKILIVSQKDNEVHITFSGYWIKSPNNRLIDIMKITWAGGTRNLNKDYYARLRYTRTIQSVGFGVNSAETQVFEEDYTSNFYKNWRPNGQATVAFELPDDMVVGGSASLLTTIYSYSDIYMTVSFWLKKTGGTIDVAADYQHQIKEVSMDILGGVALTADLIIFTCTPSTTATKMLTGIGATASGINLFGTKIYYETAGGAPCNVQFRYK